MKHPRAAPRLAAEPLYVLYGRWHGVTVLLKLPWSFDPGPNAEPVYPNAEKVRRNEAELRCSHSDDANDDAVNAGHDKAQPLLAPDENRREDRKATRDVIQMKH
jgi:hypothetical protein